MLMLPNVFCKRVLVVAIASVCKCFANDRLRSSLVRFFGRRPFCDCMYRRREHCNQKNDPIHSCYPKGFIVKSDKCKPFVLPLYSPPSKSKTLPDSSIVSSQIA